MLSEEQIEEMMRETWGCASIAPRHAMGFARAIEAEVHKQDDVLIQQMLGALWINCSEQTDSIASRAITAARKRLENT